MTKEKNRSTRFQRWPFPPPWSASIAFNRISDLVGHLAQKYSRTGNLPAADACRMSAHSFRCNYCRTERRPIYAASMNRLAVVPAGFGRVGVFFSSAFFSGRVWHTLNLSSPTGGLAYGMPRNAIKSSCLRWVVSREPRTHPFVVRTMLRLAWPSVKCTISRIADVSLDIDTISIAQHSIYWFRRIEGAQKMYELVRWRHSEN